MGYRVHPAFRGVASLTFLPLLALLMAADGDCPGDGTLADLRAQLDNSESFAEVGDVHGFGNQQGLVRARVRCLAEVVSPGDASRMHALEALANDARGNTAGSEAAFVAARTWPGSMAPHWLGEEGTAIHDHWTAAGKHGPQVWEHQVITEGHILYVDGVAAIARPVERPALYQVTDPEGQVLWSAMLTGAQPLPSEYATPAPQRIGVRGDQLLDEVVELLEQGQYAKALELSVPAVSQYPDLSVSFLAVAELAMDQMQRQAWGVGAMTMTSAPSAYAPPSTYTPPSSYGTTYSSGYGSVSNQPSEPLTGRKARFGVEMGSPFSLRLEWTTRRHDDLETSWTSLDGWGFRAGIGALLTFQGSVYGMPWTHVYLDWGKGQDLQLETSAGFVWYSGYPYFSAGAGVQYDPDQPLQVTLGAHICSEGIAPEASVGFLW